MRKEHNMALPTTGFSAIGIEEVDWGEFTSAWSIRFMVELENRAYHKDFNPKFIDVLNWAFIHKDMIRNMPFEEQERRMMADGVVTVNDL